MTELRDRWTAILAILRGKPTIYRAELSVHSGGILFHTPITAVRSRFYAPVGLAQGDAP